MPVIHTHVSVSTTPEQREALKSAYGKAITAVPGKSEGWLMCPFEDNMPIYFGGDDSKPAAYVEVNVFGRSVPGSAWEKLTEQIMAALEKELGIPADRTYIRYHRLGLERRQLLTKSPPFLRGSPILRTSHLTYGKHTVFPASRFGASTSNEVTSFLRGHGVATFARNRRN